MSSKSLMLCFQADGPYWRDLVYIPAYPPGFTYEKWQFRYRDAWLHTNVKAKMPEWVQAGNALSLDAILAARFKTGALNWVFPLRRVEITRAGIEGGVHHFYFRLGALRDLRELLSLGKACVELPNGEWKPVADENPLMFYSSVDLSALKWSDPASEGASWAKLVELISSADVPIHQDSKTATYVRFSLPGPTNKREAKLLYTDSVKGKVFGALLKEGHNYSVQVTHRVLAASKANTAPRLTFHYESANTNIELSQPVSEVIGNYQTTPVGITAVRASAAWEDFVIRATATPSEAKGETEKDAIPQQEIFTLQIPVKVAAGWWYRLRSQWIWRIIFFLALLLQGAAAFSGDFLSRFFEGKAQLSDFLHYWPVWLVLLLSSAAATFAVTAVQDRAKLK